MNVKHLTYSFCIALALAFSAGSQAGDIQKKHVAIEDIDQVEVAGPGQLTITQGDTESLEIIASAKVMERIEVDARGTTLRLRLKDGTQWGFFRIDDGIQYNLTLKTLNRIKTIGSADVELATNLTAKRLKLDSAGSGDMRFKGLNLQQLDMSSAGSGDFSAESLEAESVEITTAGSGDVRIQTLKVATTAEVTSAGSGDTRIDTLHADRLVLSMAGSGDTAIGKGEVASQTVDIGGSGDYSAAHLKSAIAEMDLSGSSDAKIWVTQELRVDASGASDVLYYGQPLIKVDTSGASSVKALGVSPK